MRPLSVGIVSVLVLCGASAIAQQSSAPVRIVNPIDEKQLVTLPGTVHPLANRKNDRGAVPDDMKLERIHLVLQRSAGQESSLRQLISDMHTPGTASYHKWLTPDSFGKQFGPSDQDIATVETWLEGHGFAGARVLPGRQTIEFSGNVGQFRAAFHAQIHKYQVNGETRYANASDPQIPAALAPVVKGFVSLNNFRFKSMARVMGKAQYNAKTDKAIPAWTWGTSQGFDFVLAPGDFAVQYDLNPLYTAGLTGTGQSIAIIDYSNINVGVVNQFRKLFSLPANPPQVIVDGNDPGIDGINDPEGPAFGTAIESYLDVEWAGAVAPNATIDLIVAADTQLESGAFLAAEHAVYANVAPVLSSSIYQYGCEQEAGSGNQFIEGLWEQAAAQGITVLEAAGDSGAAGCDSDSSDYAESGLGVNNWATTPFNLAVGGTDFYYTDWATGGASASSYWSTTPTQAPAVSIKGYVPEQPWNNSQFGLDIVSYYQQSGSTDTTIAGGSGGASNCATGTGTASNGGWATCTGGYPKPAWQTGTGVPADSVRDTPDLSLFAADGENYSFYPICADDGDCQLPTGNIYQITGVGGTSASTPAFAGIMALINQKYNNSQGQAAYVLYPLKAQFPAAFHDVTVGTNSMPCDLSDSSPNCIAAPAADTLIVNGVTEGQLGTGTTSDYNAAAGYNLATGLGTVDANVLVNDWGKVTFATSAITLTASQTSFPHGTGITLSGAVTGSGTPSGDVALLTDSTEQLQQGQTFFTLSGGSYTSGSGAINYLPGGSYNIWARYAGDTLNAVSTSAKIPITVTPESSGIDFNVVSQGSAYPPNSSFPYGTVVSLSAQPAPSSQLSAFESCSTNCPVFGVPTGTVAFADNGAVLNTALLNAEGDAEYAPPATFNAGSHSVTASYSGDSSYSASTAPAIAFTVTQATPSVYITGPYGGQYSYTQGQTSTLSIAVEGFGNGAAPAGTVTLTGAPSGTPTSATLSASVDAVNSTTAGVATVTIPASAGAGTYNVNATYVPTGTSVNNYGPASTTSAFPVVITAAAGIATTTTAKASASSTSPNAVVTVTGTVTAASGAAPTGTVYILFAGLSGSSLGEYELGTVSLVAGAGTSSTFSFAVDSQGLPTGANQLTLQYGGAGSDSPSTAYVPIGNPLSDFQMVPATTVVPVTAGGSSTVAVSLASTNGFSGAVSLTCSGAAGVTCTIPSSESLSTGSATAGVTLSAPSSTASGSYNVLITGTDPTGEFVHTLGLTAVVTGTNSTTPTFTLSNSGAISVVAGATTGNTSTVSVTPSSGFTGVVNLSCAVTSSPAAATSPVTCTIPPSESVTGTSAVTATLTAGTTASTTAGAYVITITGASGTLTETTTANVTVTAAATPTFTLSNSGAITVTQGATTGNTSTITVTPGTGFTGTVALTCAVTTSPTGAASPVTCSLSPTSADITSATAVTSTLTVASTGTTTAGSYVVTVTGTDGSLTAATTVNVTVNAAATASFTLTNGGNISVNPGSTGTSKITVNPSNGFSGTVALTCAFTTNAGTDPATCSLSPASTATTSTLTIGTTAATTSRNDPRKLFWPSAGGVTLALLLFFGLPKRRRNWPAMLGLLVIFAGLAGMGCSGGSGGSGGGGGGGNTGTTPGTYSVTVTGTSGSETQTTSVTVTVE